MPAARSPTESLFVTWGVKSEAVLWLIIRSLKFRVHFSPVAKSKWSYTMQLENNRRPIMPQNNEETQ
jgi:hypothetical protein